MPAVAPLLLITYLTIFDATGKKLVSICVVPVVDPSELIDPITRSPSSTPVSANVPFVVSAVLWAATTAEPKDAVAYDTLVMLGPAVPPISRVPTVARPVLLMVVDAIVPIVAVPVDMVTLVPNVTGPSWSGIVAVLMVAVLIVAVLIVAVLTVAVLIVAVLIEAVLMLAVAIVVVPVEKVLLDPNVTGPRSVDAPSTANVPVLLAPVVDICRAETPASSPLEMARMVASTMLLPNVFKTWL